MSDDLRRIARGAAAREESSQFVDRQKRLAEAAKIPPDPPDLQLARGMEVGIDRDPSRWVSEPVKVMRTVWPVPAPTIDGEPAPAGHPLNEQVPHFGPGGVAPAPLDTGRWVRARDEWQLLPDGHPRPLATWSESHGFYAASGYGDAGVDGIEPDDLEAAARIIRWHEGQAHG